MSIDIPYDRTYDPPAPVVPVRIADPASDAAVVVPGLVDTGADCTLIPVGTALTLGLPLVGRIEITGVAGGRSSAPVYAGHVEIAASSVLGRLVAYGHETIVGRDLLSTLIVHLDGPRLRLQTVDRREER